MEGRPRCTGWTRERPRRAALGLLGATARHAPKDRRRGAQALSGYDAVPTVTRSRAVARGDAGKCSLLPACGLACVLPPMPMAATNKCLAQSNKTRRVIRATKDTNGHWTVGTAERPCAVRHNLEGATDLADIRLIPAGRRSRLTRCATARRIMVG